MRTPRNTHADGLRLLRGLIEGKLVPFRFKKASCVVAGTFNMYIVQPMWLAGSEIIPKGIPVTIESKLDEPLFRFSSPKLGTRWTVSPARIEVETTDPSEDCGRPVADVLERLPVTPLQALGNNAIYVAPASELERLPDLRHFDPRPPEDYQQVQRSFHVVVGKADYAYNFQLSITKEEVEISANVHIELRKRDSEAAQQAARKFFGHRRESESLIGQLFKADIEHATSSNSQPT